MIKKYFVPDEDFANMIQKSIPNEKITNLNLISTGWTNIVYEAKTDRELFF